MLCGTCQNIFKGPLVLGEETPNEIYYSRDHHHGVIELYQAALQGCFICDKLWDMFTLLWTPSATLCFEECRLIRDKSHDKPLLLISYKLKQAKKGSLNEIFQLTPTREIRSSLQSGPHADRTDSAATFALASTWLDKCITSHLDCKTDTTTIKMPTRLLRLGHPTLEHLQLCNTRHARIESSYMTLSHCWGSAKFLTLAKKSSQQLSEGIHLSSLPQTFQDAAKIAKTLGVLYLWIDSLCIFQDSDEDWQREASTMGDVYKGALCNIAASGSSDSSGGCFYEREPRLIEPCIITTEYTDYSNDEYHIRQCTTDYLENNLHDHQPLFGRGWVVQERVLPPRVLHFGQKQVFWECRTEDASETYPLGVPPDMYRPSYCIKRPWPLTSNIRALIQTSTRDFEMLSRDLYNYWGKIVQAYSQCDLTRKEDKLVAISGLAREVYLALGGHDEYLAGLWRRDILSQLLWYHGAYSPNGVRPEHYRAPTWSWASMDGTIMPPDTRISNLYVTLVDIQINHLTNDAFGQVRNGFVRLRGPLLTVTFEKKSMDEFLDGQELGEEGLQPVVDLDDDLSAHSYDPYIDTYYDAFLNGQQLGHESPSPSVDLDDSILEHPLHFMPFCKGSNTSHQGLLLQPTGTAKGQFRRCGLLVNISDKVMAMAGWPSWTGIQNHSWLEYEEFDGREYTISII